MAGVTGPAFCLDAWRIGHAGMAFPSDLQVAVAGAR
jgi:hypothetical protein